MPDDKIKISWDDLSSSDNRTSNSPPAQTPPFSQPQSSGIEKKNSGDNTFLLIAGIIVAIIVLGVLFTSLKSRTKREERTIHRQTVEEWCNLTKEALNRELENPDCPARRLIKDAHLTVTVKSAKVLSVTAKTINDTNYADQGKNISSCMARIQFIWDGKYHKGGYSILEVEYDVQNYNRVLFAEIVQTNAIVNTQDPLFWQNVGAGIGILLL